MAVMPASMNPALAGFAARPARPMSHPGGMRGRSMGLAEPYNFDEGGKVKKSGWAQVKKGEEVIPVEKESRAKKAMSGGKKKSEKSEGKKKSEKKKKVHVMHVRHADNPEGGWLATHDFEPPEGGAGGMGSPAPKSEDHFIPPGDENLAAHMTDHMSQEPEPEPQAPAAQPPAPGGAGPGLG